MRNLVKIGLTACLILGLNGCDEKKKKQIVLLEYLYGINFEFKTSSLLSIDGKPQIQNLPKTIEIYGKEYSFDYTQKDLVIKNFNHPDFCDKTFFDETKNKSIISQIRCENNDMYIQILEKP